MPLISDVSEKAKKKAKKAGPEKAKEVEPEKAKQKVNPEKAKKAGPMKDIKKPENAKKHREEELKKDDPNLAKMPKYQRGQPGRIRVS